MCHLQVQGTENAVWRLSAWIRKIEVISNEEAMWSVEGDT